MVLILISWIYCFTILLGMGFLGKKILQIKTENIFYILTIGLFVQLIFLHFYLIFLPADSIFYSINFLVSSSILFYNRESLKQIFNKLFGLFKGWLIYTKILGIIISVSIWAKSATLPFIVDNETYYLQSIQWLNEYGFVKGLANLHIYFGQMSGWHILQSSFNFGFASNLLNDLNGFLMLISSLYFLNHLNLYFQNKKLVDLFLGFMVCCNLFFFQFITSPSPDFPIYILTQVLVVLFIQNFWTYRNGFNLMFILAVLMTLIKITVFPLLFFPFFIAIRHRLISRKLLFVCILGLISLSAFILKNYLVTGYPLYPLATLGDLLNPDWKVPQSYQNFYLNLTQNYGWKHIPTRELQQMNFIQKFISWSTKSKGFELIFNNLFLLTFLIAPFFFKQKKSLWTIWFVILIQFIILQITSPQYRFFLHFTITLGIFIGASLWLNKPKIVKFFVGISTMMAFTSLFFNFDLNSEKIRNNQAETFVAFKFNNFFIPEKNARIDYQFKQEKIGNLIYNSVYPKPKILFTTGDGELPCINKELLKYNQKKMQIIPQLRTSVLKDGFKSVSYYDGLE